MADPGFPVGVFDLVAGGVDSRGGYISKILYVEMKESGPLGGVRWARPIDPPMILSTNIDVASCYVTANLRWIEKKIKFSKLNY